MRVTCVRHGGYIFYTEDQLIQSEMPWFMFTFLNGVFAQRRSSSVLVEKFCFSCFSSFSPPLHVCIFLFVVYCHYCYATSSPFLFFPISKSRFQGFPALISSFRGPLSLSFLSISYFFFPSIIAVLHSDIPHCVIISIVLLLDSAAFKVGFISVTSQWFFAVSKESCSWRRSKFMKRLK